MRTETILSVSQSVTQGRRQYSPRQDILMARQTNLCLQKKRAIRHNPESSGKDLLFSSAKARI